MGGQGMPNSKPERPGTVPASKSIAPTMNPTAQEIHPAGLYSTEEIRPCNELKMWARWKLGQLLSEVERNVTGRPSEKSDGARPTFSKYIKLIKLKKQSAQDAQRLGTLPEAELEASLAQTRETDARRALASAKLTASSKRPRAMRRIDGGDQGQARPTAPRLRTHNQ